MQAGSGTAGLLCCCVVLLLCCACLQEGQNDNDQKRSAHDRTAQTTLREGDKKKIC